MVHSELEIVRRGSKSKLSYTV